MLVTQVYIRSVGEAWSRPRVIWVERDGKQYVDLDLWKSFFDLWPHLM